MWRPVSSIGDNAVSGVGVCFTARARLADPALWHCRLGEAGPSNPWAWPAASAAGQVYNSTTSRVGTPGTRNSASDMADNTKNDGLSLLAALAARETAYLRPLNAGAGAYYHPAAVVDAATRVRYADLVRMLDAKRLTSVSQMVAPAADVLVWCVPFETIPATWQVERPGFKIGELLGEHDVGVVHFVADRGCYVFSRSIAWLANTQQKLVLRIPRPTSAAIIGAHGEVTGADDLPLHSGQAPEALRLSKGKKKEEKLWRKKANAQAVPAWKANQERRRSQLNGANGEVTGLDDMTRGGSKARKLGDKAQYEPALCPHRDVLLVANQLRQGARFAQCPLCFERLDRIPLSATAFYQHSSSGAIHEAVVVTAPTGDPQPVEASAPAAEAATVEAGPAVAQEPATETTVVLQENQGKPVVYGPEAPPSVWRGAKLPLTHLLEQTNLAAVRFGLAKVEPGVVRSVPAAVARVRPVPPPCPGSAPVAGGTRRWIDYATRALRSVPFLRGPRAVERLAQNCGESSLAMATLYSSGPALGSLIRHDMTPVAPAVAGGSELSPAQELQLRGALSGVGPRLAQVLCPGPEMGSGVLEGPAKAGDVRSPEFERVKLSQKDVVTMTAAYPARLMPRLAALAATCVVTLAASVAAVAAYWGAHLSVGIAVVVGVTPAVAAALWSAASGFAQRRWAVPPLPGSLFRLYPPETIDWLPVVVDSIMMASVKESREVAAANYAPRFCRAVGCLNVPADLLETFMEGCESVVAAKISARQGFGGRPRL